ncbi:MAG: MCE family protein [Actinomycetales bacterium]|nr:MAG: MCE family protein [Actinomycetales bacterium]
MRRRLLLFTVVALVATSFVGVRYAGLWERIRPTTYEVAVELADSGGLFERAEVTFRGVTVGRVDELEFRTDGVVAHLAIEPAWRIPSDLAAEVHNRSAVGEQYIDLVPRRDAGPYLAAGATIDRADTSTPVDESELLLTIDRFLTSVPRDDLRTVVDELGTAFDGAGKDLQKILDGSATILQEARTSLPALRRVLRDGGTVLQTQDDQSTVIASFLGDLSTVAGVVGDQDGDLRLILRRGGPAAQETAALFEDLQPSLGPLLGSLADLGQITFDRIDGVEQALVALPYALASARTPGRDGLAHFSFVEALTPDPCRQGYVPAGRWRSPNDLTQAPMSDDVGCAEARGTIPRGSASVSERSYVGSGSDDRGRAAVIGPVDGPGDFRSLFTAPLLTR